MAKSRRFITSIVAPEAKSDATWWFAFQEDKLLIQPESSHVKIPCLPDFDRLKLPVLCKHYLGSFDGRDCYALEVAEDTKPPHGMVFEGLRQIYGLVDESLFSLAGRAYQIVEWDRTHQFCGRCGAKTRTHPTERAKECPQCRLLHFPRLAPAIIVLVERGPELLLARASRFPTPIYSVLAGFVEPGETLEEAVVREVYEETGITVKEICYFGSQPWPFPHSLMIGFTASYASGQIKTDEKEIKDANWFRADSLPPHLPGKISIARKLIDWFVEKQGKPTVHN